MAARVEVKVSCECRPSYSLSAYPFRCNGHVSTPGTAERNRVTVNLVKMVAPTKLSHAATEEEIALLADISVSVANENGAACQFGLPIHLSKDIFRYID